MRTIATYLTNHAAERAAQRSTMSEGEILAALNDSSRSTKIWKSQRHRNNRRGEMLYVSTTVYRLFVDSGTGVPLVALVDVDNGAVISVLPGNARESDLECGAAQKYWEYVGPGLERIQQRQDSANRPPAPPKTEHQIAVYYITQAGKRRSKTIRDITPGFHLDDEIVTDVLPLLSTEAREAAYLEVNIISSTTKGVLESRVVPITVTVY
jgi:hypothetical protein